MMKREGLPWGPDPWSVIAIYTLFRTVIAFLFVSGRTYAPSQTGGERIKQHDPVGMDWKLLDAFRWQCGVIIIDQRLPATKLFSSYHALALRNEKQEMSSYSYLFITISDKWLYTFTRFSSLAEIQKMTVYRVISFFSIFAKNEKWINEIQFIRTCFAENEKMAIYLVILFFIVDEQ